MHFMMLTRDLSACSATKDATTVLSAPIQMGLDDSLEYLAGDELIEVGCARQLPICCSCLLACVVCTWNLIRSIAVTGDSRERAHPEKPNVW